jgi:hypothetical protein
LRRGNSYARRTLPATSLFEAVVSRPGSGENGDECFFALHLRPTLLIFAR